MVLNSFLITLLFIQSNQCQNLDFSNSFQHTCNNFTIHDYYCYNILLLLTFIAHQLLNLTTIMYLMHAGPTVFSFTTRPHNITTSQTSRVEFQCSIHSILVPTFQWNFTRNGSIEAEMIAMGGTVLAGYSIIRGHRSQVLIIPSVQWRHEGVYTCIASSENSQIQAEAHLNVLSK